MRQLWFKQMFVAPIVAGEKTDTVRKPRDRAGRDVLPKVGETVGLSVGAARPFAEAVVVGREDVRAADLDPQRRALVASMCGGAGELLTRVVFRVTRSFVQGPVAVRVHE